MPRLRRHVSASKLQEGVAELFWVGTVAISSGVCLRYGIGASLIFFGCVCMMPVTAGIISAAMNAKR